MCEHAQLLAALAPAAVVQKIATLHSKQTQAVAGFALIVNCVSRMLWSKQFGHENLLCVVCHVSTLSVLVVECR